MHSICRSSDRRPIVRGRNVIVISGRGAKRNKIKSPAIADIHEYHSSDRIGLCVSNFSYNIRRECIRSSVATVGSLRETSFRISDTGWTKAMFVWNLDTGWIHSAARPNQTNWDNSFDDCGQSPCHSLRTPLILMTQLSFDDESDPIRESCCTRILSLVRRN